LIVYIGRTYDAGNPRMIGLALRLRTRLAALRDTGRWVSMNSADPMGIHPNKGEPYLRPGAQPLSGLVR
jgi:hypothetical protein